MCGYVRLFHVRSVYVSLFLVRSGYNRLIEVGSVQDILFHVM
jgi:hypothetical protein